MLTFGISTVLIILLVMADRALCTACYFMTFVIHLQSLTMMFHACHLCDPFFDITTFLHFRYPLQRMISEHALVQLDARATEALSTLCTVIKCFGFDFDSLTYCTIKCDVSDAWVRVPRGNRTWTRRHFSTVDMLFDSLLLLCRSSIDSSNVIAPLYVCLAQTLQMLLLLFM